MPGGVYGMGIVLHNIFPSIQVGTFGYMFDIPLMLISALVFGGGFGTRTVLAALYTPGFMNILTRLVYPSPEAVEALDPSQLLGGRLDRQDLVALPRGMQEPGKLLPYNRCVMQYQEALHPLLMPCGEIESIEPDEDTVSIFG